jgi:uncharacterized protein involved in propanediol utilization
MALEYQQAFIHSDVRCLSVYGVGIGKAQGSFGELLQGALPGPDNNFLVTLPIERHSWAVFEVASGSNALTVKPAGKWKSLKMARQVLSYFKANCGGKLVIESTLPEGKGMSSSSADLVATASAVANALNRRLPTHMILKFLRGIEPTDGVMYPGSVVFFHRKVQLGWRLAGLPTLHIIAIDEGGQVDTITFNEKHQSIGDDETAAYTDLLQRAIAAFERRDLKELGLIATRSAIMNQRRQPKKLLDEVLRIAKSSRALGVVVTHSGPCIGLLFRAQAGDKEVPMREAVKAMSELRSDVIHLQTVPHPGDLPTWQSVRDN